MKYTAIAILRKSGYLFDKNNNMMNERVRKLKFFLDENFTEEKRPLEAVLIQTNKSDKLCPKPEKARACNKIGQSHGLRIWAIVR